jgi:hypothetical protein
MAEIATFLTGVDSVGRAIGESRLGLPPALPSPVPPTPQVGRAAGSANLDGGQAALG